MRSVDLLVLSFTEAFEDYDLHSEQKLRVEWESPGKGPVRLRAQGEGRRYYRMDSLRPSGTSSFLWSLDMLSALDYTRREIGVSGWVQKRIDGKDRQVYLPLRITQGKPSKGSGEYSLVLEPGRELDEVFVSVARLEKDGQIGSFLRDAEALKFGYYPARKGVVIPIANPGTSGIYYVEVGAKVKGGGTTTTQIYFFHRNEE